VCQLLVCFINSRIIIQLHPCLTTLLTCVENCLGLQAAQTDTEQLAAGKRVFYGIVLPVSKQSSDFLAPVAKVAFACHRQITAVLATCVITSISPPV
jgi:hypothetical protein